MPTERIALPEFSAPGFGVLLHEIAHRISSGAVFIYPTETIYGIGGRHDRRDVYERIIAAKLRAPDNPMILIGGSLGCFERLQLRFQPAAKRLADAFWPGLLTLVLPSADTPGGVGVRVSGHPFITALAESLPMPLFSTSANISGEPYDPAPDAIFAALGGAVDFMIDAGPLPPSSPSTVVRVDMDDRVTVLREGRVSAAMIDAVLERRKS